MIAPGWGLGPFNRQTETLGSLSDSATMILIVKKIGYINKLFYLRRKIRWIQNEVFISQRSW